MKTSEFAKITQMTLGRCPAKRLWRLKAPLPVGQRGADVKLKLGLLINIYPSQRHKTKSLFGLGMTAFTKRL